MSQYWNSAAVWASPSYSELMHPQIQTVILVQCKGSAYLTSSLSDCIRCPPHPQFSDRTQPLGEPTKLLHCDGKYVPGILNLGEGQALQKEAFKTLCEVLLLLTWSIPDLDRHQQVLRSRSIKLHSSLFWIPAGSSTPSQMQANHQEVLLLVTGQLEHSEQYTHKSLHRQGICASWKTGDTSDRIHAVNPRKVQGQEELVSQLPMNTQITEPLQERDTPPPFTCEWLPWHRELCHGDKVSGRQNFTLLWKGLRNLWNSC